MPAEKAQDPGLADDRTALAWMRSALNMAASGALIARAGFSAHLDALGVSCAVAMAALAGLIWRHGQQLYGERVGSTADPDPQTAAFGLLTAATLVVATVALVVSVAL